MSSATSSRIDPSIFSSLQVKIDEEAAIREELKTIVEELTKQGRLTQSILSRIHNTPSSRLQEEVLTPASEAISAQSTTISSLSATASKYPFYKWNTLWQRDLQTLLSSIQLHSWLSTNTLITLVQIGAFLKVPINIKPPESDQFHITIEDYLLALTYTIEELARLAPNSVTMGDYERPAKISRFIKDVHAGFQLLNLKNDALRRRSDGVKYSVKKVEDVVYDLSLRGLIPRDGEDMDTAG